ncbi:thioesterase family protein [Solirubrobacter taibaiensis]|nr:thioesterase family protein [Solirubrobacter taibaiensis]
MRFEDDLALDADGHGQIAAGWETARGPHGGYVMALLASAMERAAGRPPRSLTVHFLRPPAIGPVHATATVERAGRAMTTVLGRLEQDSKPVALGLGAFADAYGGPDGVRCRCPPSHRPRPTKPRSRARRHSRSS